MVGANRKDLVYGQGGELLGALGWQSAVAHLGCRDRVLGRSPAQKARYLDRLVNNVRFLLLPWVQVPGLASVILGEGLERLRRDWPRRYGQPVWWVESFVDRQRFEGASYPAAQWEAIGWTRGFAKCGEGFLASLSDPGRDGGQLRPAASPPARAAYGAKPTWAVAAAGG
jgi:Druantia protein DruA